MVKKPYKKTGKKWIRLRPVQGSFWHTDDSTSDDDEYEEKMQTQRSTF